MAVILAVEDDKLSQKVLTKVLTGAGHEAVMTDTVAAAWDQLRRYVLVDLVILDNQLGREWGWEFLKSVRQDPVYSPLPVVVYTAHTERNSLMKYVEHGVQSVLVKPYKGDVLLKEVNKAVNASWTTRLMEDPAVACERLKITEADYYASLNAAAPLLEANVQELRAALATRGASSKINECLTQLRNQSALLGMPALETVIKKVYKSVTADADFKAALHHLQGIDVLLRLLRQRTLTHLGMGDAVRRLAPNAPHLAEAEPQPVYSPPSDLASLFCRKTAGRPIWTFGDHFRRLHGGRLFPGGEIDELIARKREEAPFNAFLETAKLVAEEPRMTNEDAAQVILGMGNFSSVYLKIASQLGFNPETSSLEDEIRRAIPIQGLSKGIAIAAAAQLAVAGRIKSPLELHPLLEHTVATSLLSFELGRMFRLDNAHLLSIGGLAQDLGRWFFSASEPGLYAVALGMAQSGEMSLLRAEEEIFGIDHAEAGRRLFELAGAPKPLQDIAAFHHRPDIVKNAASAPLVATVFVADVIARTVTIEAGMNMKELRARLLPSSHPVWRTLTDHGATLPFEVPELIDTVGPIAETTAWITSVLIAAARQP